MNVEEFMPDELDVQKAVVESLAADKAEQDEQLIELQRENNSLKAEVSQLRRKMEEMKKALENVGDVLAKNSDSAGSSKVSLLERDPELNDRFEGETLDHVLEVIAEAKDAADKEGKIRRAQLLEGVLIANEPVGNLRKKRAALVKLFNDNGNVLTGTVIAELEKMGISHKKGEEYLLVPEIIKRTY